MKEIIELYEQGQSLRAIGKQFNMSYEAVRKILKKSKMHETRSLSNGDIIETKKQEWNTLIESARLLYKESRLETLNRILTEAEQMQKQGIKIIGFNKRSIQRKLQTGKVHRKAREENKLYRNEILRSNETLRNIIMLACHFFFKAAGSGRKGRYGKRNSGNLKLTTDLVLKFAKENSDFWEIAHIPPPTLYRTIKKEFDKFSAREHHQYINHFNLWKKNKIRVSGAFTEDVEFGDWIVGDDHRSDIDKVLVWNKTRRVYEKKSVMGWDWKELKTQKVLASIETPGELNTEHLILSLMQALKEFGRPAKGILIDNGLGRSKRFIQVCNKLGLGIRYAKPHEPTNKSPEERSFGYIKNEHDVFQTNFTGSAHQEEGRHPTAALSAPAPDMTFEQYRDSLESYLFGFYETRERVRVIDSRRIRISIRDFYDSYWKNWDKQEVSDKELRYAYSANMLKKFENNKISFIRNNIVYDFTPKVCLPPTFNNRKYMIQYNPLRLNQVDIYATTNILDKLTGWQVAKGEYVATLYNMRELEPEEKQERAAKLNADLNKYHKQIARVIIEKTALVKDVEISSVIGSNGKVSDELRKKERRVKQLIEDAMPAEKIESVITTPALPETEREITEEDWEEVDKLVE